jgi:hypothetical protein
MAFQKATKKQAKARIGIIGPSGAGKTFTALSIGTEMGKKIAFIDTERGSASKYADKFNFDVMELENYHPDNFIKGISEAEQADYDVLIIDSLSHAWMGTGGVLEIVDEITLKSKSGNAFTSGWREASPLHKKLIDKMLSSKLHLIATMRSETEYILEDDGKGRKIPKKVGLAPVQRKGMEYEFDIVGDIDTEHNFVVSKSRCEVIDGKVFNKPGKDLALLITQWLTDGVEIDQTELNIKSLKAELGLSELMFTQINEKYNNDPEKVLKALEYIKTQKTEGK